MAELIKKTDTLNEGREKLNNAITAFGDTAQEIIEARDSFDSLGDNIRDLRSRSSSSLKNLIKNGDFKRGDLNDYKVLFGTMHLSKYIDDVDDYHSVVLTSNGGHSYFGATIYQKLQDETPTIDKWYVKARLRSLDEGIYGLSVGFRSLDKIKYGSIFNILPRDWHDVSFLFDPEEDHELNGEFRAFVTGSFPDGTNGKRVEVDNFLTINLTKFFGYGNEPTKEQMDEFLKTYPYSFFEEYSDVGNLSSASLKEIAKHEKELSKINDELYSSFLKNEISNGDFSKSTAPTGWRTQGSTFTISNNTLKLIGVGGSAIPAIIQTTNIPYSAGKKIYLRALVKVTNTDLVRMVLVAYSEITGDATQYIYFPNLEVGKQTLISGVFTMPEQGSGTIRLQIRAQYPSESASNGKEVEIQKVLAFDLTGVFGAGKEPTKEQVDELMNGYAGGWFDDVPKIVETEKAILQFVFKNRAKGGGALKRPLIAVTFDDGFRSDFDIVYPAFKQRGIVGTSYIWTSRTNNYGGAMNSENLIEMKLNGWGIECHTRDHLRLGDLNDAEIHEQMQGVNEDFERYGLPLPKHHALPFGSGGNVKRVQDIIMQYRKSIRNIQSFSNGIYNDWDTIDFSSLDARSVDGTDDIKITTLKNDIDLTYTNDGILILIVHKVVLENPGQYETPLHRLLAVVDYAIEKGMKFVTIDEMYNRVMEYQELINA